MIGHVLGVHVGNVTANTTVLQFQGLLEQLNLPLATASMASVVQREFTIVMKRQRLLDMDTSLSNSL